jgi:hypothetical protein
MNQLRTPLRRRVAVTLATAGLALGGLATVAAPAQAAQTGSPTADSGSVTWAVSQLLNGRMGFPAPKGDLYTAPATFDATSVLSTWGKGDGTVASDGSADLAFEGASVHWATTGNAWMRLADLEVVIDATGAGEVTAAVSYGTTTSSTDFSTATTVRGPQRVPIVDLSVSPVTDFPTYPATYTAAAYDFDSTSTSYSWANLKGVWAPELISFVAGSTEPAVAAYVYASTIVNSVDGSSRIRYPSLFSMSISRAVADTTATVGEITPSGSSVALTGTGFKKTFPGVYASLRAANADDPAYAGGAVQDGAPTAWISNDAADIGPDPATGAAASIDDAGAFGATMALTPEAIEALDPTKVYTLVTRKAHGMGQIPTNADQITEKAFDVTALTAAAAARELSTVSATVADSTVGTPATVSVTVAGGATAPTGTVTVKNGDAVVGTGTLSAGKVAVPVTGLPLGSTPLSVEYAGSGTSWASTGTTTATVAKGTAAAKITAPGTSYGTAASVVVDVAGVTGSVTLTGAGPAQTVALTGGKATFALPADLAAQAYALTASYSGSDQLAATTATATLTVAAATPAIKATWKKKPTAKKAGKLAVLLSGPTTVAAPAGPVSVVLKSGGKTVKVAAKTLADGSVVLKVKKLAAGSWKATVTYAGQDGFAGGTETVTVKVKKVAKRK